MIRALTIFQQGLTSFAVCGRCNGRFESKLLIRFKAEKEIRGQYEAHSCREVEESMPIREQSKSSSTQAAS